MPRARTVMRAPSNSVAPAVGLTLVLATGATGCQRDTESGASPVASGTVVPHVVTMKPFVELEFEEGDWVAYVFNDVTSHERLKGALPGTCLVLRNHEELAKGLRALTFGPPTGADVATVTSSLVLVRDGRVVYETGVVLDAHGRDGLQSRGYGWVPAVPRGSLLDFVKRFEAVPHAEVLPRTKTESTGTPCIVGSVAR
jgi:hypothetical protein